MVHLYYKTGHCGIGVICLCIEAESIKVRVGLVLARVLKIVFLEANILINVINVLVHPPYNLFYYRFW